MILLVLFIFSISLIGCQKREGNEENIKLSPQVQEAIEKMEKEEIGPEYVKTEESYFDDQTLHLFYEKKLEGGGTDQYDSYDVFFNIEEQKLESIKKKGQGNTFETEGEKIGEEEARKIANEFLTKYKKPKVEEVKVTTAKEDPSFMNMLEGNYNSPSQDGQLRQVYLFSNEELEIAIDQYTGQVIGGSLYKSVP